MRIALFALIGALAATAAHAEPNYRVIALAGVDGQILPAYRQFAESGKALDHATVTFCTVPTAERLAGLRDSFHAGMDAWQAVQHISYGPVEAFHRGQRVHFWPDKKSSGDRQLLALLKERKAEALEGARIAFASVAVQGLPALEMLLFGEGQVDKLSSPSDEASFRCRVLTAIAANIKTIGAELVEEWVKPAGFREAVESAGSGTSPYNEHRQAAAQAFNALHGQLLAIAEVKLAHPLGNALADARPGRAENWRSKRSLRNVDANLAALRALFAQGFAPALAADGKSEINTRVLAALDRAAAAARQMPSPMEEAMVTPDGWKKLSALKGEVKAAARLLEAEAAPALGLQIGFNALDGD